MTKKVNSANSGFITIAQGSERYIDMAKNLGYSLSLTNPHVPKAIITDSDDSQLHKIFDMVIPINKEVGVGTQQKLLIYHYSPFPVTMFIDCDCLVINNLDFLWTEFGDKSVGVIGSKFVDYSHWNISINHLKSIIKLDYLIKFNGGLYYFKKDSVSKKVFETANLLLKEYSTLGIQEFRGGINEEPLMSIAMSLLNICPLDDRGRGMYTPIDIDGTIKVNALKGFCRFKKNKEFVTPSVVHFCGDFSNQFHYKRESTRIKIKYKTRLPTAMISLCINVFYNIPYSIYILNYRLGKSILKKQPFKLSPMRPVFRSW